MLNLYGCYFFSYLQTFSILSSKNFYLSQPQCIIRTFKLNSYENIFSIRNITVNPSNIPIFNFKLKRTGERMQLKKEKHKVRVTFYNKVSLILLLLTPLFSCIFLCQHHIWNDETYNNMKLAVHIYTFIFTEQTKSNQFLDQLIPKLFLLPRLLKVQCQKSISTDLNRED